VKRGIRTRRLWVIECDFCEVGALDGLYHPTYSEAMAAVIQHAQDHTNDDRMDSNETDMVR